MPVTYEPIASTTLGSANTTITFSSISGSYTDLKLIVVTVGASTTDLMLRFNSDTGTNYSDTVFYGDGSSASAYIESGVNRILMGEYTTSQPTLYEVDIFAYAGSTNKTVLIRNSSDRNGSGYTQSIAGLWRNTAAITSVSIVGNSNLNTGTVATLYGILKA